LRLARAASEGLVLAKEPHREARLLERGLYVRGEREVVLQLGRPARGDDAGLVGIVADIYCDQRRGKRCLDY
jgi:hypothetical protein